MPQKQNGLRDPRGSESTVLLGDSRGLRSSLDETLLFESANSLSAQLHLYFFAIDDNSLLLKIRLPDFLGVALRKTDIAAVLLALTGEITFLHRS